MMNMGTFCHFAWDHDHFRPVLIPFALFVYPRIIKSWASIRLPYEMAYFGRLPNTLFSILVRQIFDRLFDRIFRRSFDRLANHLFNPLLNRLGRRVSNRL